MGVLPYEHLTIETTLAVEEAQRRLAEAVEPRNNVRWPFQTRSKPFEGSITGEQFEISRVISYRNSFLPRINGRIRQGSVGATIDITLAMHPVVMIFMAVWLPLIRGTFTKPAEHPIRAPPGKARVGTACSPPSVMARAPYAMRVPPSRWAAAAG